jgi:DNA polymerase III alpha subunit (gram-positive type)
MDARLTEIAETCLHGAEDNSMTFPEIVQTLMQAGFESYAIDFRRATATYYVPGGDSVVLPTHRTETSIGDALYRPPSWKRSSWCPDTRTQASARRS